MKIKHTVKVNKLPEVTNTLVLLNGRKVTVGAFNGENAWLAGIHEYGCKIEVTPKMRKFLAAKGLYLNSKTKYIVIPERSFLRTGHDENIDSIMEISKKALNQVTSGQMSVDTFLDMVGEQLATAIKDYMVELDTPPNHPFTKEQKGSSNPLVDTGNLVESITWRVK